MNVQDVLGRKPFRPKVMVIYPFFPHYRSAVIRSLAASALYDFEFWGSKEGTSGIKGFLGDEKLVVHLLTACWTTRRVYMSGYWRGLISTDAVAFIILGSPNWPDTWLMALYGRLTGKSVLFWTHGWLRRESFLKRTIRNCYFRLSHLVLTYNERAKDIAVRSGFPGERILPIYNSMDWEKAQSIFSALMTRDIESIKADYKIRTDIPLLVCTGRLIKAARLDMLLLAMSKLRFEGLNTQLILIGDGPERQSLEEMTRKLDLEVTFMGEIYSEENLGPLVYASDITVMPGKVGLTAIHSFMYGTPVITHSDFDHQMPEVEAIEAGVTGAFFQRGNSEDLANKIKEWICEARDRAALRIRCQRVVREKYNPTNQRELIETALNRLVGKR